MSTHFLKVWAALATTVAVSLALLFLGVMIGQNSNPHSKDGPNDLANASARSGALLIPDTFTAVPDQWRTPDTAGSFDGYAILFDLPNQELIVERCKHRGYFDVQNNQPIDQMTAFCDSVLSGTLIHLDEHSATVTTRNGETVELALALTRDSNGKQLSVAFADNVMELTPGSKNDLFQAMDATTRMTDEKRLRSSFLNAENQKLRSTAATSR